MWFTIFRLSQACAVEPGPSLSQLRAIRLTEMHRWRTNHVPQVQASAVDTAKGKIDTHEALTPP